MGEVAAMSSVFKLEIVSKEFSLNVCFAFQINNNNNNNSSL